MSDDKQRVFYRRQTVRERLGVKTNHIIHIFEARGWLTPVRLSGQPLGDVFYPADQIEALPERLKEWEAAND